ncbi:MAG TPA: hypothetical protein VEW69_12960 [Alphaproteobacteria bacterium]|nr:hypothetical protein [Alphaproteobacteria bacterium]
MPDSRKSETRPRLACEITSERVIAARASDATGGLEMFTSRRLNEGTVAPGLNGPNVLDARALQSAISGALGAVSGKSKDVVAILPDSAVRVFLLDFDMLPAKLEERDAVVRFRLKKSLPFDVEQAAMSYQVRGTRDGMVQVVVAVAPRAAVEEYEEVFRQAGYAPGVVLPSTVAALGIVDATRPTLLLKVDPNYITVAAADAQELRLIRTLENPHGADVSATVLADAVLPSIVFFEDTFGSHIEEIMISGDAPLEHAGNELAALLRQHTGATIRELAPGSGAAQNLSGDPLRPSQLAAVAGALTK